MTVTYRPADEPARIAGKLINKHHDHLAGQRIEYVFRSTASKSNGKVVLGKARKVTGLNAYLAQPEPDEVPVDADVDFFVIEFAEDEWAKLDTDQREALVDHELCHLQVEWDDETEEITLKLRPHDLEEFNEIVRRHGLWRDDVREFAETIQPTLPGLSVVES